MRKHGISFEEAQSVFYDEFVSQFYSEDHLDDDDQFAMLGVSYRSRVLIVCHCERESSQLIRIIPAKSAMRRERKFYDGAIK